MSQVTWGGEYRDVSELRDSAQNPREHPPAQLRALAASLQEFGFTIPVLVDEQNTIIAGHARVTAARMVGMSRVPVIVAADWTPAQKAAFLLIDNRLAELSRWDTATLKSELHELAAMDVDLASLGFPDAEERSPEGEVSKPPKASASAADETEAEEPLPPTARDYLCPQCMASFRA